MLLEVAYFAPDAIARSRAPRRSRHRCQSALRARRRLPPASARRRACDALLLADLRRAGRTVAGGREPSRPAAAAAGAAAPRAHCGGCSAPSCPTAKSKRALEPVSRSHALADDDGWLVTPPSWRFDMRIEADLIEEVRAHRGLRSRARATPSASAKAFPHLRRRPRRIERALLETLVVARLPGGDHATPSSIPRCRRGCSPMTRRSGWPIRLPRDWRSCASSLWPGLLQRGARESAPPAGPRPAVRARRDVSRRADGIVESARLAGIAARRARAGAVGRARPTPVDFFDVKADVEALFATHWRGRTSRARRRARTGLPASRAQRDASRIGGARSAGSGELHPATGAGARFHDLHRSCSSTSNTLLQALRLKCQRIEEISRFPQRAARSGGRAVDEESLFVALRERVTCRRRACCASFACSTSTRVRA